MSAAALFLFSPAYCYDGPTNTPEADANERDHKKLGKDLEEYRRDSGQRSISGRPLCCFCMESKLVVLLLSTPRSRIVH